jgi:hypothetical protein
VIEDDNYIMCGPPFIKYDIARFDEMVRGPVDEVDKAVDAFILGKSEESAGE